MNPFLVQNENEEAEVIPISIPKYAISIQQQKSTITREQTKSDDIIKVESSSLLPNYIDNIFKSRFGCWSPNLVNDDTNLQ
jgi:hypothetical protein